MSRSATFFVPGIPQQKGSTKSFLNPKTRKIVTKSDNVHLKGWESVVRLRAAQEWRGKPVEGGCEVTVVFVFPRPKTHLKVDGKSLAKRAPREHVSRPDLDKLARGLLDALTGVIYKDDSQVCDLSVSKSYTLGNAGAHVSIRELALT